MNDECEHFERLFEAHEHRIRAYCARRLDVAAVDDAVAETFAVAWRKVGQIPEGDAALPWLYGVAHRVVQHAWRGEGRRARLRRRVRSSFERPGAETVDDVTEREDRRLVLAAAARLHPDDQEVLRLTLWEELTPTDAAAVLGITPTAARQRAHRARTRLADEFRRVSRTSGLRRSAEGAAR